MKAVNVDNVLKILYEYGAFIFTTDSKRYTEMVYKIANLPELKPTRYCPYCGAKMGGESE